MGCRSLMLWSIDSRREKHDLMPVTTGRHYLKPQIIKMYIFREKIYIAGTKVLII